MDFSGLTRDDTTNTRPLVQAADSGTERLIYIIGVKRADDTIVVERVKIHSMLQAWTYLDRRNEEEKVKEGGGSLFWVSIEATAVIEEQMKKAFARGRDFQSWKMSQSKQSHQ